MHPDKKVGLALGILLIGITGAFFFRNDVPAVNESTMTLSEPETLDRKVRQKPGAPYFPENASRVTEQGSDCASLPESLAADVIPSLPGVGQSSYRGLLPDPVRNESVEEQSEHFADRRVPLPSSGQDFDRLDAAVDVRGSGGGNATRSADRVRREVDSASARPHSVVKETSGTIATTNLKVVFHEVVAGDNLSRLAEKYLGSHSKYLELYEANRDLLGSPDDLSPGMMLKIPQEATRAGVATNKSKVDISTPKTKGTTEASVDRQAKSAFVQPNPTSLITVGRTGRSGRSLSQTPPEDLPRVAGLEARSDATAIASRPKETSSSAGSNSSKAN